MILSLGADATRNIFKWWPPGGVGTQMIKDTGEQTQWISAYIVKKADMKPLGIARRPSIDDLFVLGVTNYSLTLEIAVEPQ